MQLSKILLLIFVISFSAFGEERVLHPDFPVVDGIYQMTSDWSINLDQSYNRRVENGSLVFWRPGLTIWINVWGNDNNQTIEERLEWLMSDSPPDAFDAKSTKKAEVVIYGYRLNKKSNNKDVYSYNGFVISKDEHIQISVYFDELEDEQTAIGLVDSISNEQS